VTQRRSRIDDLRENITDLTIGIVVFMWRVRSNTV
jgi:hypothetical protein